MIKVVRCILLMLNFAISSTVGLLMCFIRPFHPSNTYFFTHLNAYFGLRIIGVKTNIIGEDNYPTDRPFIVVANHQSNWDLMIVGGNIPKKTVALGKASLKWIPVFGQMFWLSGNILLDRGNRDKAMKAMDVTKKALTNKNVNIWFFAEGTRNQGKNMLPFKKGAFITAINSGVPIVRVCTNSYLDHLDMNRLKNGDATIRVLPPIETKGLTKKDLDSLMKECHDTMSSVIKELDD
jgi:1-acyl-sn-glycerol-3-phosphate acyltransferase